ncbi:uncharacterized protein LOC129906726 [Episyrphus balteatus]|uniref:uncharacterized protein LOC129906726 n=1 Tax=Episyrphus balteatus TaxID=286459 RepID=UPI0024866E43|nr:uncharacterized protein LOC129906726 [Episyrphus balteatus]
MYSSTVLSVFLVLAIVAPTTLAYPAEADNQTIVDVITVDDVSNLKDLSQGAKLIPLSQSRATKGTIVYTLGQRVSLDKLVGQGANSQSYKSPQNVRLQIQYPNNPNGGDIVTYVRIDVDQSSNDGQAYVLSGGIGQRRIIIIVEAYNTLWFNYNVAIYAKK